MESTALTIRGRREDIENVLSHNGLPGYTFIEIPARPPGPIWQFPKTPGLVAEPEK